GNGATATAGDATWIHRFHPFTLWSAAGGDFASSTSSAATIGTTGRFSWNGLALLADVQSWVDDPSSKHGWIMRGDEASSANTKRFDSRQSTTAANRPTLTITYLPAPPTGGCCLDNGTCLEVTEDACIGLGGAYRGDGTDCVGASCPVVLAKFVDPLPFPAVAQPVSGEPGGAAHYVLAMTEQFQRFHRDLPLTRVWGYEGSYPGPTIEARSGEPVTVIWRNQLRVWETGQLRTTHVLPVDTCLHGPDKTGETPVAVVHLHGGKVDAGSDGFPDDAFAPGQQSHLYTYPNEQPAATIWYHDHALGITRLNVMMGLAGFYLIRDDAEEAMGLPSGAYEVPLAIQDRSFNPDGSLRYQDTWHDHFFGDNIVVNGKVWPYLDVARGKYRFRLLNGSTSRAYTLSLSDGATFWQIGTDLGLMEAPLAIEELTLLPGERADVVVDFAGYAPGTRVEFRNSAPAPFPGFPGVGVVPEVMQFRVGAQTGHLAALPAVMAEIDPIPEAEAVTERTLDLMLGADLNCPEHKEGMWMIDGRDWDEITEFPVQGTTEIWTWRNDSGVSHPMHIHLVAVQVLGRQAIDPTTGLPTGPMIEPAPTERGWKDTVDAPPGFYTSVIARFDGNPGFYPYHCHILEHEDHEMMRQFELLADCDGNGIGDRIELQKGLAPDCDGNGVIDSCDIAGGAADVDANGIPDACEPDCNGNGLPDAWELSQGLAPDCDGNGAIDSCDIAGGAADVDADGRLDSCERAYGDFDLDGSVGGPDLAVLLGLWGSSGPGPGDLNGDGAVNAADLAIFLGRWGLVP
ncbi:MAG: multicopper oxidase domain-containing protein, partial [Planctomycetota bacterium]